LIAAWAQIECATVKAEIRKCAMTTVDTSEVAGLSSNLSDVGLEATVLPSSDYDTVSHILVSKRENVASFLDAWRKDDHSAIGYQLGYPLCCVQAYCDRLHKGIVDPLTYLATHELTDSQSSCSVYSTPLLNPFLRRLRIHATPHIPCSLHCVQSMALGNTFINLGQSLGYEQEIKTLLEILDWPIEWTTLHGIGEIKVPVFKVCMMSDGTFKQNIAMRWLGKHMPLHAATGRAFPFDIHDNAIITSSSAFARGLAHTGGHNDIPSV
jgi:hypothetical protein